MQLRYSSSRWQDSTFNQNEFAYSFVVVSLLLWDVLPWRYTIENSMEVVSQLNRDTLLEAASSVEGVTLCKHTS